MSNGSNGSTKAFDLLAGASTLASVMRVMAAIDGNSVRDKAKVTALFATISDADVTDGHLEKIVIATTAAKTVGAESDTNLKQFLIRTGAQMMFRLSVAGSDKSALITDKAIMVLDGITEAAGQAGKGHRQFWQHVLSGALQAIPQFTVVGDKSALATKIESTISIMELGEGPVTQAAIAHLTTGDEPETRVSPADVAFDPAKTDQSGAAAT